MAIEKALDYGLVDGYQEAENVIIDITLLQSCDFFVGKFTSNIDRIAYGMMAIRNEALPPFVSTDATWCFDYGKMSGKHASLKDHWFFC